MKTVYFFSGTLYNESYKIFVIDEGMVFAAMEEQIKKALGGSTCSRTTCSKCGGCIHLQLAFFMNKKGELFPCDEASKQFISTGDYPLFYDMLQSIRLNSAITNTTIILRDTSYTLKSLPLPEVDNILSHAYDNLEFVITLQNQALFSSIIKSLNNVDFQCSQFENLFNSLETGIFITNSDSMVIYANQLYRNLTGLSDSEIIGNKIEALGQSGVFTPLITPMILKTLQDVTTLQYISTGKYAVISGSPIYDSSGKPIIIVTCINVVSISEKLEALKISPNLSRTHIPPYMENQAIDVIAESQLMRTILQKSIKVAGYDVTVLILGETGVGKEVISAIIHASSKRKAEKFVKINCSAISPNLLESELFGYEPGSFTGALSKGKQGLFEVANNGTLLLDEIGDMPYDLQSKMLRVLQDREFYRVGGITPIKTNVRIIAATNKNLPHLIAEGKFRNDLYYRLNVVSIEMPSLVQRTDDIRPLLQHFCYRYNRKYGTNKKFSNDLLETLENYTWPGNVRELQNVVECLCILCNEEILDTKHFYNAYYTSHANSAAEDTSIVVNSIIPLNDAVSKVEQVLVSRAMALTKNTRRAASLLGVSQSTIMRKIKQYDIEE